MIRCIHGAAGRGLAGLLLLALIQTGASAQVANWSVPPGLVTAAVIEAKINEVESDPQVAGEDQAKLIALYRTTLTNLEQVERNRVRAVGFAEEARTDPEQTRQLRERIAETQAAEPAEAPPDLGVDPDAPLHAIEQALMLARAERDATLAQRHALERRLTYKENRPALIRQRLGAVDEEQRVIASVLQTELAGGTGAALSQARRWELETRYIALSAEMMALDQELASLPIRIELLRVQRDLESAKTGLFEQQAEALQGLLNRRRNAEARQVKDDSERWLQASAGQDPALIRLAARNVALATTLSTLVADNERLDAEQRRVERLAARINANFERVKTAKAIGVSSEGLGQLLLEHRATLPNFERHARRLSTLKRQIAAASLSQLRHLEEAEQLAAEATTLTWAVGPQAEDALPSLLAQRRGLLERKLAAEGQSLERLRRLQTAKTELLAVAQAYDAFLTKQIFWLPTGPKTQLAAFADLPQEAGRLLSPEHRAELGRLLTSEVAASPVLWLALLLAATLRWKRRALIGAIKGTARSLKHPATDRFGQTLRALLLTLALAAPLPLVLGVAGWLILAPTQDTELSLLVGIKLVHVAVILFVLLALRRMCLPGGLASAHFRWPEADVRRLDLELRWMTWVVVPAVFVLRFAKSLDPAAAGGLVTRLGLLVAAVALAVFLYRVLHPRHGLLRQQRQRADAGLLYRMYLVWFPLLLGFPLLLPILAWNGYVHTTVVLGHAFLATLGMLIALILVHALAVRWLSLARRRLAVRAARERRAALAAHGPTAQATQPAPSDEADLDLDAASADSLHLLRGAVGLAAAISLYLIWSAVFPALGILDELTLWHSTTTIDGELRRLPISLADLGLALIYLGGALLLAKRLPALLDLILAQHLAVASGDRYTITALTAYIIVAVGLLLALNTIGAQWSQLQWLVAALGVGIGFGLQEIVANFISGLIILFERPIRIGDIVSVGDTDGTVTKIRIRATTIRNWDRKELLVPNKEFITGRLLNWSLSDQVTRLMITVGVAYGTDVERAHALMREAATEHPQVLSDPEPILTFEAFGDNALTLTLRAYIDDISLRIATRTDLHKAINRKFAENGIRIAFPQRDLHLDTDAPLRVRIEEPARPQLDAGATDPVAAQDV